MCVTRPLAIDRLSEKKKRPDISTITDFLYQWSDRECNKWIDRTEK